MTFRSRHERLSDYRIKRLTTRMREVSSQPEISEYNPEIAKVAEQIWRRMDEPGFTTSEDFFDLQSQFTGMQAERLKRADALYEKIGSVRYELQKSCELDLTFRDYTGFVSTWLKEHAVPTPRLA